MNFSLDNPSINDRQAWKAAPPQGCTAAGDMLGELAWLSAVHSGPGLVSDTSIPQLSIIRSDRPTTPVHLVQVPSLCFVLQGSKRVIAGNRVFEYAAGQYLAAAVETPISGQVVEASAVRPYLCLRIAIRPAEIAELIACTDPADADLSSRGALELSDSSAQQLNALLRLVRLLDDPAGRATLAPLFLREILFHALRDRQVGTLRQIAFTDSTATRIGRAITAIREQYRDRVTITHLAACAGMSTTSFHQHFKDVTGLSPLQFQKRLRLLEARRLFLSGEMTAAQACFHVGYASPSQFSRDYSRCFGASPRQDFRARRQPDLPSPVAMQG